MPILVSIGGYGRRNAAYLVVGLFIISAVIGHTRASHEELESHSEDAAAEAVSEVESRVEELESTKDDQEDRISELESRERY